MEGKLEIVGLYEYNDEYQVIDSNRTVWFQGSRADCKKQIKIMTTIEIFDNTLDLGVKSRPLESNTVTFTTSGTEPILELKGNGDIFVKGKLIENDIEVVDALREFLKTKGYIDTKK